MIIFEFAALRLVRVMYELNPKQVNRIRIVAAIDISTFCATHFLTHVVFIHSVLFVSKSKH